MAENNVRSAPAGPVPDITVNDYHLGEILAELNCWCEKWKGNINAVYNNALSMADQIAQLFQVVYTTVEAQEDVTGAFKQLYDFVNDYFTNLDLQEEVNNIINQYLNDGTLDKIIRPYVINGGKPVFVNSTSQMTDNTRIYILISNGHIYYWSGSSFVDSNLIYGHTEFPINEISTQNLGTIIACAYSGNAMNTTGYYVNYQGGLTASSVMDASPFVPITPNTQVYMYRPTGNYIAFYTKDLVFISAVVETTSPIISPENARYFRASLGVNYKSAVYLNNSVDYLTGINSNVKSRTMDEYMDVIFNNLYNYTQYLSDGLNLCNYNNPSCIKDAYYNINGIIASDTTYGYKAHPLIYAEPNSEYYFNGSGGGYICFYDSGLNFISSIMETSETMPFTTPENTAFMGVSIQENHTLCKKQIYSSPKFDDIISSITQEIKPIEIMTKSYSYSGDTTIKFESDTTINLSFNYPYEKISVTRTSLKVTTGNTTETIILNETFPSLIENKKLIFILQYDRYRNVENYIVTDGVTVNKFSSTYHGSGEFTTTNSYHIASKQMNNLTIWTFADSYAGTKTTLVQGALNTLGWEFKDIFSYPGEGAQQGYEFLVGALKTKKPDVLIWLLGMNGGESISVNILTNVKNICAEYGILLIPSTIPNVPNRLHNTLNQFIKDNFTYYIDWNKTVNPDIQTDVWYDGMLSGDNVHPTSLGSQALAIELLGKLPMNKIY